MYTTQYKYSDLNYFFNKYKEIKHRSVDFRSISLFLGRATRKAGVRGGPFKFKSPF